MSSGTIKKVAGPLVIAKGMRDANMFDVVRVSDKRLIGEIIEIHGDEASIQVYEETSGLGPGAPVDLHRRAAERRAGPRPHRQHLRRHPAALGRDPEDLRQQPAAGRGSARPGPGGEVGVRARAAARRPGGCRGRAGHRAGDGDRLPQDHGAPRGGGQGKVHPGRKLYRRRRRWLSSRPPTGTKSP